MRIYFDDDNEAYFYSALAVISVKSFFCAELNSLRYKLENMPIDHYRLVTKQITITLESISIEFENKADEAYFKILTADGIEI
jgi:hypothetical protein